MTVRIADPAELFQLLPTIASKHHVVLITADGSQASAVAVAAWAGARAIARNRRSVLLADLGLAGHALDAEASWTPAGGITDVFLDGADLHEFAAEQEVPGLHYIGGGKAPDRMGEVWRSDRWQRLARGFEKEGALLILCAPPAAAQALRLDGLQTFAVEGAAPMRVSRPIARKPAPNRSRSLAIAGVVAAVLLCTAAVLAWSRASGPNLLRETARRSRPAAPRRVAVAENPDDSLYYSVQVAAYSALPQAMEQAASLEHNGYLAMVSPARMGTQGVWYRVLAGALPTARAADSVLQKLWQAGLVERPQGTILRTPDTYRLKAARNDLKGLRARGIPAYIVSAPDGTDQVLVGAFDLADQAGTMDSLLGSAGLGATLVRRTGSSQ